MRIEATQQSQAAGVTGAIQQAAKATGTSFQYLLATAKVESNLNPNAAAKTSSAGGLFQFIEQTWLGTIKEAGPSLGYGRYANAITRTDSGRYVVANPEAKAEILKLRQDPTANAMMAGVLTKSNAAVLSQKLGRQPTDGELYIAHFLGAKGAATLIGQSEQRPGVTAASVFPNAARANRSIFFDKEGRPRNVAEVSSTLSNRFQVALAKQPAGGALAQAPIAAPVAPVAVTPTTATRAVATTNPLAIPQAASVPPSVAGRLAAITPVSSSRGAIVAPFNQAQSVQTTDDLTPITSTANARVTRAYEVLSPNMVRSLTAPVSTTSVPTVSPVSVAPERAPRCFTAARVTRRRAGLLQSVSRRRAPRARRARGHRSVGASLRQCGSRPRADGEYGIGRNPKARATHGVGRARIRTGAGSRSRAAAKCRRRNARGCVRRAVGSVPGHKAECPRALYRRLSFSFVSA